MRVLATELDPQRTYRLMTGIVVPRPIAWVCTRSPEGTVNIAPFSAFTFVSTKPPMVGINVGRKAGVRKDTGRNIHAAREYTVHICDEPLLDAMHESSVEHPPEVSEVELLGLRTTASDIVSVPRLVDAPIAMECRLVQAIAFGDTGSEFMVGEVLAFHLRDGLLHDGKIDSVALNPICRLAGPNYATLGPVTTKRPIQQTDKSLLADGSR
ncbi:flavin reductase family protein [Ramlibacter sp.]|uniref:flavin reductase family protein n=1 Tax=Ramlibacter sp. TaxID=1917967 RepID=UPI003D12D8AE